MMRLCMDLQSMLNEKPIGYSDDFTDTLVKLASLDVSFPSAMKVRLLSTFTKGMIDTAGKTDSQEIEVDEIVSTLTPAAPRGATADGTGAEFSPINPTVSCLDGDNDYRLTVSVRMLCVEILPIIIDSGEDGLLVFLNISKKMLRIYESMLEVAEEVSNCVVEAVDALRGVIALLDCDTEHGISQSYAQSLADSAKRSSSSLLSTVGMRLADNDFYKEHMCSSFVSLYFGWAMTNGMCIKIGLSFEHTPRTLINQNPSLGPHRGRMQCSVLYFGCWAIVVCS